MKQRELFDGAAREMVGYFDGASRGNPGEAGAGACLLEDGRVVWESARYLGRATNNEAEYTALIDLLAEASSRGVERLSIMGDSKLVISQMRGEWKIKEPRLAELASRARALPAFGVSELSWVPRERNKIADALSNRAIDEAKGGASR